MDARFCVPMRWRIRVLEYFPFMVIVLIQGLPAIIHELTPMMALFLSYKLAIRK